MRGCDRAALEAGDILGLETPGGGGWGDVKGRG
jgi:5-oxoprolinase (ATP-hydrolysing)